MYKAIAWQLKKVPIAMGNLEFTSKLAAIEKVIIDSSVAS